MEACRRFPSCIAALQLYTRDSVTRRYGRGRHQARTDSTEDWFHGSRTDPRPSRRFVRDDYTLHPPWAMPLSSIDRSLSSIPPQHSTRSRVVSQLGSSLSPLTRAGVQWSGRLHSTQGASTHHRQSPCLRSEATSLMHQIQALRTGRPVPPGPPQRLHCLAPAQGQQR